MPSRGEADQQTRAMLPLDLDKGHRDEKRIGFKSILHRLDQTP